MSDWGFRGDDYDSVFATVKFYRDGGMASQCHKAIAKTTIRFSPLFPGWPLYRRIVSGDSLLDRTLQAYAIDMGRALSRAETRTGRQFIGRATRSNDWIRQASLDALDMALFGKAAAGKHQRAGMFDVSNATYQKLRDGVASGIWRGIESFRGELHHQFRKIILAQKHPVPELDS